MILRNSLVIVQTHSFTYRSVAFFRSSFFHFSRVERPKIVFEEKNEKKKTEKSNYKNVSRKGNGKKYVAKQDTFSLFTGFYLS